MAATKKKKVDPVKQREKRVKIAAIVGVVLFLAVAAYEIPSMLAVMNKKPPAGSTYDPGPSSALPNVAGGAPTAAATPGQLVDTDIPPSSNEGQLVSFSVFQTKNPFTPQVSDAQTPPDSGPAPSASGANKQGADVPTGATTTPTDTTSTPTSTVPAGSIVPPSQAPPSTTTPTTTTPSSTTPVQPTVAISVNGAVSRVSTQGTFPSGTPVFRLVSWSKGTAQIGIVGGSYATGDPTIALRVGTPVTLENQTDGKRYKIELLSTP